MACFTSKGLLNRAHAYSRRPEVPKDPDGCNVFAIYKNFAPAESIEARRKQYLHGGLAYSDIKQELFERLGETFAEKRQMYFIKLAIKKEYADDSDEQANPIKTSRHHRPGL